MRQSANKKQLAMGSTEESFRLTPDLSRGLDMIRTTKKGKIDIPPVLKTIPFLNKTKAKNAGKREV
jgi:hypothetical protein